MNDLKQTLTEIGDGTPVYDVVDSALAKADRQRRTRRWTGTGAAFTAVLAVAAVGYALPDRDSPVTSIAEPGTSASPSPIATVAAGPLHCAVASLPVPSGYPSKSLVTGGDPTGRYHLGRVYPSGGAQAVVWDGRTPKAVDLLGSDDTLSDVNSAGLAVGTSLQGDAQVAWAYRNGRATRLKGGNASAIAVNERGQIAGTVGERPVIWRTVTAEPEFLALPKGITTGQVRGIDEDGTVAGNAVGSGDARTAYAWRPDGTPQALKLPATTPQGVPDGSAAYAIRNGRVSGEAQVTVDNGAGLYMFAMVWDLRTGDVKLTPQIAPQAQINAQGWLVGRGEQQLVLLTDAAVVPLPLPGGVRLGRYDQAETASDDGTLIAGQINSGTDTSAIRALLWTCS